jgi:tetratricopeptide (TPR) repeat protein/tRNA A-37 threonylcarbamoyl transferase component Bud32
VATGEIAEHDSLIGRLVGGKFRIRRLIGSGAMGRVYLAEQTNLGKQIALKVLQARMAGDAVLARRFYLEAKSASMLAHPNILQIIDFGNDGGLQFIAMELLSGRDLSRAITEDWPLDPGRIGHIGAQILSALDEAHSKGVVHRDLKPANVMLLDVRGEPDFVKVCDFGVAKVSDHSGGSSGITVAGMVCGTPEYMSPEQARGLELDGRSDLYAAAVILYQMVVGDVPFHADSAFGVMSKVLHEMPERPSRRIQNGVAPALEAVILKGLQKSPNDRFATAAEMKEALLKAVGLAHPTGSGMTTIPRMPESVESGAMTLVSTPEVTSQPIAVGRRRALKRALPAAILAVLTLGVWTAVKLRRPHATASTVAARPQARRAVAVLGFQNLSGRLETAWLSTALSEMLGSELGQTGHLRTLSGEDVARMKAELHLREADSLAKESLARIRRDLDADLALLGSYTALEGQANRQLRIDLRVQDTSLGETVATVAEVGTEAELFDLVARVGHRLRQQLGVDGGADADSQRAIRAALPANLTAARLYAEGLNRLRIYDALTARELLSKALVSDASHAPSHVALAQAWSALGYDSHAEEEARKALELVAPLSREQRLSIQAYQHMVFHEWAKAVDSYQTLFDFFPDNLDYGLKLAEAQWQGPSPKQALETLERLRNPETPQLDDPRIDEARGQALFILGDFKELLVATAAAKKKARARGADLIVAKAAQLEANALMRLGDCGRAIEAAEEAKGIFARTGDRRGVARTAVPVGLCRQHQNDPAGALRVADEMMTISEDIGDHLGMAWALHNAGNALADLGRPSEAIHRWERALDLWREVNNLRRANSTLGNIASIRWEQGDLVGARRHTEEAVAFSRKSEDHSYYGYSLTQLAQIRDALGELAGAQQAVEQAIALQRQGGEEPNLAIALGAEGSVLLHSGKLDEARAALDESGRLYKKIGAEDEQINAKQARAELELALDRPQAAEPLEREAVAYFEKKPVADSLSRAHERLARVLLAEGQTAAARKEIELAASTAPSEWLFRHRLPVAITEARIDGTEGRYEPAKKRLEHVLQESRRAHDMVLELDARMALVEVTKQHSASAGRAAARALHTDAARHEFGLIAKKAAELAGP